MGFFFLFFPMAAYAMVIVCLVQLGLCGVSYKMSCLPENYGVKLVEVSERAGCALGNLV